MDFRLDHIGVVAASLEEGAEWVRDRVGAELVAGGRHAEMGTHNQLLSLGPGLYFEVIAIDPDAPPPGRPRWFGIDEFSGPPRLSVWMLRTPDLDAALETAAEDTGEPKEFARGDYRWRLAVPRDGRPLPLDGVAPALIQWHGDLHPADALPPSGVSLTRLEVSHPSRLADILPAVDRVHYLTGAPGLRAVLGTPHGEREI